jgi:hypothetical protein
MMRSLHGRLGVSRVFVLGITSIVAVASCVDPEAGNPASEGVDDVAESSTAELSVQSSAAAGSAASANTGASADGEPARAVVERLRRRHVIQARVPQGVSGPSNVAGKAAAAQPTPVIGPSSSARLVRAHGRLEAKWQDDSPAEVWMPGRATEAFALRDRASGLTVQARLADARDVEGAVVDGLAVYEGAAPAGGTVLHRLIEGGTEDYVTFETRPEAGLLSYDVWLTGVAGLRLVGNTLEFVDKESTPRLRIAPPFVVGARGEVVEAVLSLSGCAADRNPAAPWDRPPVAPGRDHCRVEVSWDVDAVSYPAIVDPSWSNTASMSTGRFASIGVAINTNRVLVSGGYSPSFTLLRSAELYNPSTRTWAATGNMVTARVYHEAAVRGNGTVLVAGGYGDAGTLASAETYNPSTGSWTSRAAMSKVRQGHRLTTLANGDVLVTGGLTDGTTEAQRFSNSSSTWSSAGYMLTDQNGHTATLLNDGRVLVVGGNGITGQLFQPSNNSWIWTPSLPEAQNNHVAVRLSNGNVLLAGGYPSGQSCQLYDAATQSFSRTGGLWQSRYSGTSATLLSDGRVLVVGGSYGSSKTSAEIYDPTWGTWRPAPQLADAPSYGIMARMQNNRVLVAGGMGSGYTISATAREFISTTTATSTVSYKFPAAIDNDVRAGEATEIWAALYRPTTLPSGRLPLILMLHGNHDTCGTGTNPRDDNDSTYTSTGSCPANYVVTPNHRGYDYIATELASRGYIVVSINANRGITGYYDPDPANDPGLILARARLVLKHLQRLSQWNRGTTTPSSIGVSLNGKLDLTQVGLMGHSRGGEAMRAAYNLYRASGSPWPGRIVDPVTFRGIFEIGPTDGWRGTENAVGTSRAVLLPMCDGDVGNLEGVVPFDRMMSLSESSGKPKSTYTVWGANHNYYNTEWQISESGGCTDHTPMFSSGPGISGSAEQRQSGFQPMLAYFLSTVGNTNAPVDTWFGNVFNPESYWTFSPTVQRGFTPGLGNASSYMLEDFLRDTGTSSYGIANVHNGIAITHMNLPEHGSTLRGAEIFWYWPGVYFQTNFANPGSGFNLSSYQTLDLRVERVADTDMNPTYSTDFQVQLVNSNGTVSSGLWVRSYMGGGDLTGPVGGPWSYHSMLQTARFPLSAFSGATLNSIRGVRLLFSQEERGRIYVANIRASKSTMVAGLTLAATEAAPVSDQPRAPLAKGQTRYTPGVGRPAATKRITDGNQLLSMRQTKDGSSVQIELGTPTKFRVRDAALVLRIGEDTVRAGVTTSTDNTRVVFTLDRAAFEALPNGAPVIVRYQPGSDVEWDFGILDKTKLTQ